MTYGSETQLRKAVASIASDVHARVSAIGKRTLCEKDLWLELTCCVLSSQVPYELAEAAAYRLHSADVFAPRKFKSRGWIELQVGELLCMPLIVGGNSRRYRFPRSRATQIAAAWEAVADERGGLAAAIACHEDALATRAWLVRAVPGMGPKQASMFLRNTGISYDMAIIDRHVSDYMLLTGLWSAAPNNLSNLPRYQEHEVTLKCYANDLGYSVGVVDWAIWIVMRAAKSMD